MSCHSEPVNSQDTKKKCVLLDNTILGFLTSPQGELVWSLHAGLTDIASSCIWLEVTGKRGPNLRNTITIIYLSFLYQIHAIAETAPELELN